MRKRLIATVCAGVVLLVAVTLAVSRGHTKALSNSFEQSLTASLTAEPERLPYERFEVTVMVGGRPLEEYYARGRRYVEAIEGAEYELRIRNPLPVRVAVALSVDGMNTIDARRSTAWNASKWVIEPYSAIYISGWQVSGERARRFYFTTERDSYGAKLGQTANLGNISAVFFRERTYRPPVPVTPRPVEPLEENRRMDRDSQSEAPTPSARERGEQGAAKSRSAEAYPVPDDEYAATGIGRSVRHDVRWINLDLDPRPAAEVLIRYEYRAALVRLGILPRPYPQPDPLRRRESSTGFEDRRYSPEP